MKIKYVIEYVSKETNKPYRSNLGYNINFVRAAVFDHLQKGDFNLVVIPVLEDCPADDPDNVEITEVAEDGK